MILDIAFRGDLNTGFFSYPLDRPDETIFRQVFFAILIMEGG
jgi:hypothetical protein